MTKADKVAIINATIQNERNECARKNSVEAYLNENGQLRYRDKIKGYTSRISFSELLGHLHGEDILALRKPL